MQPPPRRSCAKPPRDSSVSPTKCLWRDILSVEILVTATTQDGRRGGFGYINRVTNLLHERHGEIYTLQPGTHFTFRHLPMRRRRRFLLF